VHTNIGSNDAWFTFGLAFVGGYADAASFVLAKTFTGHVTGNLVLGAIAVAAHDWSAVPGRLSAIVAFLIGVLLSTLIAQRLKARPSWRLLPTIMGIEVILIMAASLTFASDVSARVQIFMIVLSLALGLQNGAFRRAGGISVHTTFLTGMITSLITTEVDKYTSRAVHQPTIPRDPTIRVLSGIWVAFVLGAGVGAATAFHFKGLGMLGAALVLIALTLHDSNSSQTTESPMKT
jgi:uncharacterized membrane protein YoaK (UPF0700 family)